MDILDQYLQNQALSIEDILEIYRNDAKHTLNDYRSTSSEYHRLFHLLKRFPGKFQGYMRMKLETFEYILSKVDQRITKRWCNLHKQPIRAEEKLVITIRFLATGATFSDLSLAFLMEKSTVCYLIDDVLNALWQTLGPLHMPPCNENQFMNVAKDFFLKWNVPHCIGVIDIRHIRIKKPPHSGARYYNYKNFYSITLQAVVSADYRFLAIDVGGYGHQHDATTFRCSSIYKCLQSGDVTIPEDDQLNYSRQIAPYFFIGDGAYPLNKNMMKPYAGNSLSENEKLFNKRISRARACVECAFGQLCQKWRIFYKSIECDTEKTELITKVACTLINVIKDVEKSLTVPSEQLIQEASVFLGDERENTCLSGDGEVVRRQLIHYFLQNPI